MKPGFMIYSLARSLADGTLTVPQALALIKELGAHGVDLDKWNTRGLTPAQLRTMVADAGLVTSCFIGGADLTTADPATRTAAVDSLKPVVDAAAELGTANCLVTIGACPDGMERAEGRRNVARALALLLPHAEAAGVTVSIEPSGSLRSPCQTSEECLELCALVGPGLKLTYDTGNMVLGDEDPVVFLRAAADRVVHAHAKDWELLPPDAEDCLIARSGKKYIGTVVGTGVLNYPAIVAALREIGYAGYLSFEYEGRGDPVAAARQGMDYLCRLIAAG